MATITWTQADIDTIRTAIAQGAMLQSLTTASGETYSFRSMDDMLKLLAVMEASVNGGRTRYAATSKGA